MTLAHLAALGALYFAGVKLGLLTVLPEGMAIVWPANAVVLAALLRFGGARLPLAGLVVVGTEVAASWGAFPPSQSVLFGLINFGEAVLAWLLLRRLGFDPRFPALADLWRFVLAGPVAAAIASALLGAAVYTAFRGAPASYPELVRTWWLGDAVGLLIVTPLLLSFGPFATRPRQRPAAFRAPDAAFWVAAALGLAALWAKAVPGVLLLPFVLYVAARYPARWASAAVAACAVLVVAAMALGREPFGALPAREAVLQAQEFLVILAVLGLGFSALLGRLRAQQAELERRVAERTRELEEANAELARLATVDPLTGVGNRRLFDEVLEARCAEAGRYGGALAVVLADLDRFKEINDTRGHPAGDEVLRGFARLLRAQARSVDVVARYGGEEFALLLPGTGVEEAATFAERVRGALAAAPVAGIPVTASFGVAALRPGGDARQLVAEADAALYEAKREGRNRVAAARTIVA